MENSVKITPPEGYEVDKDKSTFEEVIFKPIKKELPKTWEEFCKQNPTKSNETYVTNGSLIYYIESGSHRDIKADKNLLPSWDLSQAMIALCQLIQLRDCYNGEWEPNWSDSNGKYTIVPIYNKRFDLSSNIFTYRILAFKSAELRDKFFENFSDLIEIARPLL